jgi:hypothetical protein
VNNLLLLLPLEIMAAARDHAVVVVLFETRLTEWRLYKNEVFGLIWLIRWLAVYHIM